MVCSTWSWWWSADNIRCRRCWVWPVSWTIWREKIPPDLLKVGWFPLSCDHQRCRHLVANRPVRAVVVVVYSPRLAFSTSIGKVHEPVGIQALRSELAIQALDEGIVRRFARARSRARRLGHRPWDQKDLSSWSSLPSQSGWTSDSQVWHRYVRGPWRSSIEIMMSVDGISSITGSSSPSPSHTSTGKKSTTAKDSERSLPDRKARRHW